MPNQVKGLSDAIVLTIQCDANRTSPNQRMNRWEKSRRQNVLRLATHVARQGLDWPEGNSPVRIDFLVRRGRALDADNIVSGAKVAIDTICNRTKNGYGFTPDDSAKWVRLGSVEQEIGKEWKGREQLVLTVTPLEEET